MTNLHKESRRDLRIRAFQALMALEFEQEQLSAIQFAYNYDKEEVEVEREIPAFLLNLVSGVVNHQAEIDESLSTKLKSGWSLDRLTLVEKNILRLGLCEIKYFETPNKVAVNEAVELAKDFSNPTSARFINGVLSQFVISE